MRSKTILSWLSLVLALMFAVTTYAAGDPPDLDEYLTPGTLSIDGSYYQEGMNARYMDGYSPNVENGYLNVVLPLLASSQIDGNILYCDLDLGSASESPFLYTNYDSIPVYLRYADEDSEYYNPLLYVASFSLPLKADRQNGVYNLGVSIRYRTAGHSAEQVFNISFTIYDACEPGTVPTDSPQEPVDEPDNPGASGEGGGDIGDDEPSGGGSISGGGSSGGSISGGGSSGGSDIDLSGGSGSGGSGTQPPAASEPKVILENYVTSPNPCDAGAVFTTTCTLRNTSRTKAVKNMTVTFKSQTTDLIPSSGTSTAYIERIKKNSTAQFAFSMKAAETAASGPQKIDIALSYEGEDGTAYTATDEITVLVQQKIRLEWDQPTFPSSVFIGDTMNASLNLYNKGKSTLYNVTVALDVPGLTPDSSAFLGNMESGASKSADIYASVTGIEEDTFFEEAFPSTTSSASDEVADSNSAVPDSDEASSAAPSEGTTPEITTTPEGGTQVSGNLDMTTSQAAGSYMDMPLALAVDANDMGAGETIVVEGQQQEEMGGETQGNFIITYEDEYGDSYTRNVPVSTFIETVPMDNMYPEDMEPMEPEEPQQQGMPWWGWVAIAGGGCAAAGVGVHQHRKKQALALIEDDDELS